MKLHIYILIFFCSIFYQTTILAMEADENSPIITTSAMTAPPPPCAGSQSNLRWLRYDLEGWSLEHLYEHPFFPQAPDGIKTVNTIQTPLNYDEGYGSLIRGYLVPPETGNYQFNATGDDTIAFFLSTTELVIDTNYICGARYAWITSHDNQPTQTSEVLTLTAGEYYYFELQHKEGAGGDQSQVYWKTPSNSTWSLVPGVHLYDYTCDNFCDVQGTPCDDGDANTINDQADGFCNCAGEPVTANDCVGDKNSAMALFFDNVSGWQVQDLINSSSYMTNSPDRGEIISNLAENWHTTHDNYGMVIKAYFSPPVTGIYSFNVMGDSQVQLFLSSDDNPANLTSIALGNYAYEHDDDASQTSANISLNKGQYYYLEFFHKEQEHGEFFGLYWKAPFLPTDKWTAFSPYYLHAYDCELACIPDGTSCNDGNAGTENDVFTNCNCAGTPCPNNNCLEGGSYDSYDYCAPTNGHSNNDKDVWLSCQTSSSPNVTSGNTHWIQYDFGELKTFTGTHVWNYNVTNETGKGFRNVVIDYSTNGTDWTQFGTYEWPQAPGTNGYTGFIGPNLNNLVARYILVTGLTNWEGTTCRGLSEMAFTVEAASLPLDLLSFNAVPEKEAIHLFWEVADETDLKGYTLQRSDDKQNFKPMAWIESERQQQNRYQYIDEQVRPNLWYYYRLKMVEDDNRISYSEVKSARLTANGTMEIYPNPTNGDMNILITTTESETVMIDILSTNGQLIRQMQINVQEGLTQQAIDLEGVAAGTYWVKVYGSQLNMTERVVVF